jgi:hypothetical protein
MSQQPPDIDEAAARVHDTLVAVRREQSDAPEDERRAAFQRVLDDQLSAVPEDSARRIVASVRERLIAEARDRGSRLAALEAEVTQLRAQLQAAEAERDRLREQVRASGAAAQEAGAAGGDDTLRKVREGLLRAGRGEELSVDSLGLPDAEARLFRLIHELIDFTLQYERSVNFLLDQYKVRQLDSVMVQRQQEMVRKRFVACLEDEKGSVGALRESLDRNKAFLVDMNKAYQSSIFEGTRAALREIDPQPIADRNRKAIIGVDHAEAWKEISRAQGDLATLSRNDLWERYFFEPFRAKMSGYLESA